MPQPLHQNVVEEGQLLPVQVAVAGFALISPSLTIVGMLIAVVNVLWIFRSGYNTILDDTAQSKANDRLGSLLERSRPFRKSRHHRRMHPLDKEVRLGDAFGQAQSGLSGRDDDPGQECDDSCR